MSLAEAEFEREINPVDMIEHVASHNQWEFERSSDDEICLTVDGVWTNYSYVPPDANAQWWCYSYR